MPCSCSMPHWAFWFLSPSSLRSSEVSSWQFVEDTLSTWKWVWDLCSHSNHTLQHVTLSTELTELNIQTHHTENWTEPCYKFVYKMKTILTYSGKTNGFIFFTSEVALRVFKNKRACQLPPALPMFTGLIQDSPSSSEAVYVTHQNTQSQPFSCMNGPLSGRPLDRFPFRAWSYFRVQQMCPPWYTPLNR